MADPRLTGTGDRHDPEHTGAGDHAVQELSNYCRCPDKLGSTIPYAWLNGYCVHGRLISSRVVDDNVEQMEARMKIYLSASFDARDIIEQYAGVLIQKGHEVTSNWLWEPPKRVGDEFEAWEFRARANDDLADIDRADAVVMFTEWPSTSGGRHGEFLYGIAKGKRAVIIGPRENVFEYLSVVEQYDTWEDYLDTLE